MNKESRELDTKDGEKLHIEIYENGHSRWLIATHGIGEYSGRHHYIKSLFSNMYNIVLWDLRGHGRSSGKRTYVSDFENFALDLKELVHFLRINYRMNSHVLFGHSMGALVTCDYLKNFVDLDLYPEKVFLSAPPIRVAGPGDLFMKFVPKSICHSLANLKQSIPLPKLVDASALSHDKKTEDDYNSDPFNSTSLHTKIIFGLMDRSHFVFDGPINFKCRTFCAYGSKDKVVSPQAIEEYFEKFENGVELKKVDGGYHELHNEIERFKKPYFEFLIESLRPSEEII